MNSLTNVLNSALGLSLVTAVVAGAIAPRVQAQMNDQEFQMGRAREACTAQARQQGLSVNRVVSTVPVNGSGGRMIGSEVTLNVTRRGETYNVRCDYDNASRRATISLASTNPPSQSRIAVVTANSLNVRSAPGTNSRVLYQVPRGTELIVLGETSRGDSIWYRVQARSTQYPQAIGYAFGRYLRLQ